jgi:hypothetical protein
MRISKRNPIFILAAVLTFALGVFVTPVKQPKGLVLENVLVLRQSPWKLLRTFENQDLLGLDEHSTRLVEGAVEALTGRRYANEPSFERFQPALFRAMLSNEGEKRYVLVELAQITIIPGNSYLRVHIFDSAGYLLNTQKFNAGYRTSVGPMRIRNSDMLQHPVLMVDTSYCLGGHPGTQFYALNGDRIVLVYLEQDNRVDHNSYPSSHFTIGPQNERSIREWEDALDSTEDVEVLSALVWFNGNLEFRTRDRVSERLEELKNSENYFIKRAAESVLESTP